MTTRPNPPMPRPGTVALADRIVAARVSRRSVVAMLRRPCQSRRRSHAFVGLAGSVGLAGAGEPTLATRLHLSNKSPRAWELRAI